MPTFSGGGSFNGGTIGGAVTIAPTSDVAELTIQAPAGQVNNDILDVFNSTTNGLTVSPDGQTSLLPAANTIGLQISAGSAGNTASLLIATTNLGAVIARIDPAGRFVTSAHSAPADDAVQTGEAAIWFDQTNGAAKLMVKAKQADGTVKTGSITLA